MSALSLQSCHYYSHLPDNIQTPGQLAPVAPAPDPHADLADQQQFDKSSERSLRAEEGVPSEPIENLEMSPARSN